MTHLRRTGTTVGSKVLLTEYTLFKSKKELFLADSKYKQNVININILSNNLAEEGCSTIHASDDADALSVNTTVERRDRRYQRGNQNLYIEEEQTTQWPKEKSAKGQTTIYKTYIYN
jgi:hypothetical protein